MRIVAGEFKSRILQDPRGHRTHPMSEKVRGALFNVLGDVSGLTVLDAFAGSGVIGIEALSRGAARVVAVDTDKDAFKVMKANRDLVTDEAHMSVHRANISSWLATQDDPLFDIVIADPPYDDIRPELLQKVAEAVKPGGILVFSLPPAQQIVLNGFELVDEKRYGDAKLVFYKR